MKKLDPTQIRKHLTDPLEAMAEDAVDVPRTVAGADVPEAPRPGQGTQPADAVASSDRMAPVERDALPDSLRRNGMVDDSIEEAVRR